MTARTPLEEFNRCFTAYYRKAFVYAFTEEERDRVIAGLSAALDPTPDPALQAVIDAADQLRAAAESILLLGREGVDDLDAAITEYDTAVAAWRGSRGQ